MLNFEFVFNKVVRVWREKKIVKNLGFFRRILVAPDKATANQIAQAMVGETIKDVEGCEIEGWHAENLEPRKNYEVGLGDVISVSETAEEPIMGNLPHPIPNYDYIWRRVKDKLRWHWFNEVAVEFVFVERTHILEEVTKIDGVIIKSSQRREVVKHFVGIKAIHNRKFKSYEESESFIRSLQTLQAAV